MIAPEKMKNIKITKIKKAIKNLLVKANFELPEDIIEAVKKDLQQKRVKMPGQCLIIYWKMKKLLPGKNCLYARTAELFM
jgi:hypothetical protein